MLILLESIDEPTEIVCICVHRRRAYRLKNLFEFVQTIHLVRVLFVFVEYVIDERNVLAFQLRHNTETLIDFQGGRCRHHELLHVNQTSLEIIVLVAVLHMSQDKNVFIW